MLGSVNTLSGVREVGGGGGSAIYYWLLFKYILVDTISNFLSFEY